MLRRIALVAVTLTALALTTLVPPGAAAPDHRPDGGATLRTGAVFNDPYGDTAAQDAIKDHIIDVVNRTPRGQVIRAALYALTDQDYTDALLAAHERGVTVRIVLDAKYSTSDAAQHLITALGGDTTADSWVRVCMTGGACIAHGGVNPINHNKFFLFSRVDGGRPARTVVLQTSTNQTAVNTAKYFNNAYTVVGNARLYAAYVHYFTDLAAMVGNNNYFTTGTAGAEGYYFFPQETGDIVVDILDRVTCTGNRRLGTAGTHRSIVRVSAFALHRVEVADALKSLAGQGCEVDIVFTDSNQAAGLTGVPNVSLRRLKTDDGYLVHSKYFLIEGTWAGHRDTAWTFTGSHNLDFSSLRENDETLLRIEGTAAHDAYRSNFEHLSAVATPVA